MKTMVAVLLLFFVPFVGAEEITTQPDAGCVMSNSFIENEAVQLILNVEETLIKAHADMQQCMSDYASTVQGCIYGGAKVSIVKNPTLGWGISVEKDGTDHGLWIDYSNNVTVKTVSDLGVNSDGVDQVASRATVEAMIRTLILPHGEDRPLFVRYEVDK